jgi:DNA-binding NtrC family response regulator
MLFPMDLPDEIRAKVVRKTFTKNEPQPSAIGEAGVIDPSAPLPALKEARARVVESFEEQYLEVLLKQTHGSVKKACGVSGLSRSRFYTLIKKYKLSPTFSMIKAEQEATEDLN